MNKKLIESLPTSKSIEDFRTLMNLLSIRDNGEWTFLASDEILKFKEYRHTKRELVAVEPYTGPGVWSISRKHYKTIDITPEKQGSWTVWSLLQKGAYAGIEACEINGKTIINFYDGYDPWLYWDGVRVEQPPIGPAFEKFSQWVKEEMGKAGLWVETQSEPPVGGDAPGMAGDDELKAEIERLFPNPKTLDKTRKKLFELVKLKRTSPNLTIEQLSGQLTIGVETVKDLLKMVRNHNFF